MNDNEAKFILRAYRPDGSDAQDPIFTDALAQAGKNPALREWLEQEKSFDRAIAAKLHEVQPPAGLRDAILAGGRASQRRRAWWKNPVWLAIAASLVVALTLFLRLRPTEPSAHDFAEFALNELATATDHHGHDGPALAKLQAHLASASLPLPVNAKLDGEELRRSGCHTARFAGHEVFEICFERDGKWFHLYATPLQNSTAGSAIARSLMLARGKLTATAWHDAQFTYALVTDEGVEALRRLI